MLFSFFYNFSFEPLGLNYLLSSEIILHSYNIIFI